MAEQGDSDFTLPSLLVLAAIGLFAWQSAPLESARPPSDVARLHDHGRVDEVPARLWQDPFHAVELHLEAEAEREPGTKGLSSHGRLPLPEEVANALAENDQLVVLLAPLTPGAYSEIEERRRRRRYAVLAALGDSDYAPRSASTLGLLELEASENSNHPDTAVPYEWYDLEDATPTRLAVLVLWIDESWLLDAPFARLNELIEATDARRPGEWNGTSNAESRPRWVMLGPSQSGTLREMARAVCKSRDELAWLRDESGLASFEIISPVATVDDHELEDELGSCRVENGSVLGRDFERSCSVADGSSMGDERLVTRLCLERTIRSDRVLIEELAAELADRRGLQARDTVVVLSEWDTYFGRSLPRALEAALEDEFDCPEDTAERGCGPRLLQYTYERGIDGLVQGEENGSAEPAAAGDTRSDDGQPGIPSIRRPFGTGQFDYLRRLAQEISREHDRRRLEDGRGIRAVAILGSDVYDKLLILRALRDELPTATWITTDLDANLLHPDEYRFTRNLVVASTFDLTTPSVPDSRSPPFRDSYQTSAWLATRIALDPVVLPEEREASKHCAMAGASGDPCPMLPPILFEVGRHGVVRLSGEPGGPDPGLCITCEEGPEPTAYAVGGLLVYFLGVFAVYAMWPRSGWIVIGLLGALLVVVGFAFGAHHTAADGEPLVLNQGVSVWPTIVIRFLTALLTGVLIWRALRRLDEDARQLGNRFFGEKYAERRHGDTLGEAWAVIASRVGQLLAWPPRRPPAWIGFGAALFLVLFVFMLATRRTSPPVLDLLRLQAVVYGVIGGLWWYLIVRRSVAQNRLVTMNAWRSLQLPRSAAALWASYRYAGERRHRVLRAATNAFLYFAFGSIVFGLLGDPGSLGRGSVAPALNGVVTGIGVLMMIFLLFLVVDAIQLCMGWIRKLASSEVEWTGATAEDIPRAPTVRPHHAACWLKIMLIGERTREVGRLLYAPLLVILLMLLARSSYFDGFAFPKALAIVVGLNFTIVLVAAARLNVVARDARNAILEDLRNERRELKRPEVAEAAAPTPEAIDDLIKQLDAIDLGAFQRLRNQPLARTAAVLLTAIGITWGEYGLLLN